MAAFGLGPFAGRAHRRRRNGPPSPSPGLGIRIALQSAAHRGPSEPPKQAVVILLAFDIGNTTIHIGLFDGERLTATWRIGVQTERMPDEYGVFLLTLLYTRRLAASDITACII